MPGGYSVFNSVQPLSTWFALAHLRQLKDAALPEAPQTLIDEFSHRYVRMYEQITGVTFEPGEEPIELKILTNLMA